MIQEEFVDDLYRAHFECKFPRLLRPKVEQALDQVLEILFPQLSKSRYPAKGFIIRALSDSQRNLASILGDFPDTEKEKQTISEEIVRLLPVYRSLLLLDIEAMESGDPAALSRDEVIVAYPGFYAIAAYRLANLLYQKGAYLPARLMTEIAHSRTGIDIHPAATIGSSFCIDHGTGIVIGETTQIGNNVKIYQGVTIGALSVEKQLAGKKRHPTIEDEVIIYANATILGGETVVGKSSIIGGNVWLTKSVPPGSKIYHTQ